MICHITNTDELYVHLKKQYKFIASRQMVKKEFSFNEIQRKSNGSDNHQLIYNKLDYQL